MRKPFLTITVPLILWTLAMIIVSSTPGKKLPEIGVWNWDKLAHTFEFLVFSLLLFRYLYIRKNRPRAFTLKAVILIGICYAGFDELHQLFIPNRCCTWKDFIADVGGVLLGGLGIFLFYTKRIVRGTS